MLNRRLIDTAVTAFVALACLAGGAKADDTSCGSLPSYTALKTALASATSTQPDEPWQATRRWR